MRNNNANLVPRVFPLTYGKELFSSIEKINLVANIPWVRGATMHGSDGTCMACSKQEKLELCIEDNYGVRAGTNFGLHVVASN